jgi:signal peptidase I
LLSPAETSPNEFTPNNSILSKKLNLCDNRCVKINVEMKTGSIFSKAFKEVLEFGLIGLAVLAFVYIFAGQPLRVTGDSMLPNFLDGEQIVAEKVSVKTGDIERGEVIIFKHPVHTDRLVIKRVIALPGEKVQIMNKTTYINGIALDESYLGEGEVTEPGTVIHDEEEYEVPANSYILMGDNRGNSTDSRHWGAVNKDMIIGKGLLVYYPLNNIRLVN